jgi:hypothetical protein
VSGCSAASTGVLALHDFLNGPQVAVIVNPPPAPISFNTVQQAFALPPEKRSPGNIEPAADLVGFIFLSAFVCNHGTLSGLFTNSSYSKYTYDDTHNKVLVKIFFIIYAAFLSGEKRHTI